MKHAGHDKDNIAGTGMVNVFINRNHTIPFNDVDNFHFIMPVHREDAEKLRNVAIINNVGEVGTSVDFRFIFRCFFNVGQKHECKPPLCLI